MKNNFVSSLVLSALSVGIITPVIAQPTFADIRQKAVALLEQAKTANPNPKYWADKTVEKAKRMWSCFIGSTQCSIAETKNARAWIVGTSTAILTALLIAGGLAITKRQVEQVKSGQLQTQNQASQPIELAGHEIAITFLSNVVLPKYGVKQMQDIGKDDKHLYISGDFSKLYPQDRYEIFYDKDGFLKKEMIEEALGLKKTSPVGS